jgi:hypothetical protein
MRARKKVQIFCQNETRLGILRCVLTVHGYRVVEESDPAPTDCQVVVLPAIVRVVGAHAVFVDNTAPMAELLEKVRAATRRKRGPRRGYKDIKGMVLA